MADGLVTLRSRDPEIILGPVKMDAPPKITAGGGGYSVVGRPRNVGFVEYQGADPYRLDLSLLLDGILKAPGKRSVEDQIGKIDSFSARSPKIGQPPAFTITGPVPFPGMVWVVESAPSWGDVVEYNDASDRIRQDVVLHLVQFVQPATLALGSKVGAKHKTYTVRKGDTLRSIAAHHLGSAKRWAEIAKLNHLRDGRHLKAGTVLRLP